VTAIANTTGLSAVTSLQGCQSVAVMGKIVFLKIVFYFKIENTILFSIFKIVLKSIL